MKFVSDNLVQVEFRRSCCYELFMENKKINYRNLLTSLDVKYP
jgi:hypothetical protein